MTMSPPAVPETYRVEDSFIINLDEEGFNRSFNPRENENIEMVLDQICRQFPISLPADSLLAHYLFTVDRIFVGICLTKDFSEELAEFWERGEFLKAAVLDMLLTKTLFAGTESLYRELVEIAGVKGLGLSRRRTPGDNLSLMDNIRIVEGLRESGSRLISVDSRAVLNPHRSLVYKYLLREGRESCEQDIPCRSCGNPSCELRSV